MGTITNQLAYHFNSTSNKRGSKQNHSSLGTTVAKPDKNEALKKESVGLRGEISAALHAQIDHFEERERQLIKFHGSYQQDDRDLRRERRRAGLGKAWQFMVRSKIPGGQLTADQYLMHDRLADKLANGSLRFTNRQGIQLHGVLAGVLKECIQSINESGLTTWGACGDIVRNTMACAVPLQEPAFQEVRQLARQISEAFYARSRSYSEIWLDGQKLPIGDEETNDPLYGATYLPRKFKIGIALPPYNDVDVLTNDTGLVADVDNGKIAGFDVYVGGGMGMSFGKLNTQPALGKPLFYIEKFRLMETLKAIVSVQRDFGRRDDRSQARLKYLIRDRGIIWFRNEVAARLNFTAEPVKSLPIGTVADLLGWREQGDGRHFYGMWIPDGRVSDTPTGKYRSALKALCERFSPSLAITPNANIYLYAIEPHQKIEAQRILDQYGINDPSQMSAVRRLSHACVALPTCGLALAESERVFQSVIDNLDRELLRLGISDESLLVRMSGCPNGCPRPYNADFAFVGRAPGKYAVYVGGSLRGDRLARLWKKSVPLDGLIDSVQPILEQFACMRQAGETFSDYWFREKGWSGTNSADQFHIEPNIRDS